jgi:hypothetical protein
LAAPAPAWAVIRTCVIDGGGNTRICGISDFLTHMRASYVDANGKPIADVERVYTGMPSPSGDVQCVDQEGNVQTEHVAPRPPGGAILPATRASVSAGCLAGAGPGDVCHLWSMNHGFSGNGTSANYSDPMHSNLGLMDDDIPGSRMSAVPGACGTVHFVSNSCFSAPLNLIFRRDDQGNDHYIPGRCGVASNPFYRTSLSVEDCSVTPCSHRYPFADAFSESLSRLKGSKKTVSQDNAFVGALMNDPTDARPTESSDFYLERRFPTSLASDPDFQSKVDKPETFSARSADSEVGCTDKLAGPMLYQGMEAKAFFDGILKPILDQASSAPAASRKVALSPDDDQFVKDDLESMQWQLKDFAEEMIRRDPWKSQYASKGGGTPPAAFFEVLYLQFAADRKSILEKTDQDLQLAKMSATSENLDRVNADRARLKALYNSTGRQDGLASVGSMFERYELLRNRLGNAVRLYESGESSAIHDFISLRKCETGDFYAAAAR